MSQRNLDCVHCGGRVRQGTLAVDYRWGKDLLAVVRNVPAGVCEVCGQEYVEGDVLKRVEAAAHSRARSNVVLKVAVRSLATV